MKATVGALMMSTSAMVVGAFVALEATLLTLATVQGGVGRDTPVEGLTVGVLVIIVAGALVAAFKGAKSLILFTLACGRWVETMNSMVTKVDALERWRVLIVDPSLTRSGIGKPNPVSKLYDEEAAG